MKSLPLSIAVLLLWLLTPASFAASTLTLPPVLQPWVPWVLENTPERDCPFLFSSDSRNCSWPSELTLDLTRNGGSFQQRWSVYKEGWATLPGGQSQWPVEVTLNETAVAVSMDQDMPAVYLQPGDYLISGQFQWERLPEALPIPLETGIIHLTIDGKPVAFPYIDKEQQRLWIQRADRSDPALKEEDRLELKVFRRLTDELPMSVESLLRLQVSGAQREVLLDYPMLPGAIPLNIDSPLPARLESDGRLRVQVRAGTWTLRVKARFPNEILSLAAPAASENWPGSEIWVFDARPQLRLVELSGATAIDPRQTNLPREWRKLPAYRLQPGEQLAFQVQRRGDPAPEPNRLNIERDMWLDFDGGGYTVRDRFSGSLTSGWRLQVQDEMKLGRAELGGKPQFITRMGESEGVEVRRGVVDLLAESRLEKGVGSFSATGWQEDFSSVGVNLHLPPGWRVFSVKGVDNIPATWLQGWTLLDIFLVMMTAIAVGRLWGWGWSAAALFSLVLLWHEPDAPRYVWLNIVAAVALLRVVPVKGRLRNLAISYRALSLVALVLISIPFIIQEVRVGIYPQLERPWQGAMRSATDGMGYRGQVEPMVEMAVDAMEEEAAPAPKLSSIVKKRVRKPMISPAPKPVSAPIAEIDPNAVIQTGPGIPQWQWNRLHLSWNGPVEQSQRVSVIYLSPMQNLLLNILRILFLLLLAYRMVGNVDWRQWLPGKQKSTAVLLLAMGLMGLMPAEELSAAEIPPAEMLDELQQRLLKPPQCLPACADMPRMELAATANRLQMRLQIHVLSRSAVPLPGNQQHWLPELVSIDGGPAKLYRDDDGVLWTLLEPGLHQLALEGALPQKNSVQIPLALSPRVLSSTLSGWSLEGLNKEGIATGQVQLVRLRDTAAADDKGDDWEITGLPPFVMIERTLQLGLDWSMTTRVRRLSPSGVAVVLRLPLLDGESVITSDVEMKDGHALATLDASARSMSWRSVLKKGPEILLRAAETSQWVESWVVDVSPIWHMETEGIPVVHHTDNSKKWHPRWRPWPGESVRLNISRPQGSEGNSLTIQQASLDIKPGKRASDAVLQLKLQSSQGGRHSITLPEAGKLQTVSIDGRVQPIRQQERAVSLPVKPGMQSIELHWRSDTPMDAYFVSPAVNLNAPAVNLSIKATLGSDRWLLFIGGPSMGPAVLFWGIFVALMLAALILARLPNSPLKHYQWLLLGLGLSQADPFAALLVAGWLLALGYRGRMAPPSRAWRFDLIQIGLALLTLTALAVLFASVQQGLLGRPDMMVAGNSSSAYELQWYQDRARMDYPQGWVISVPIMVYRIIMLVWAMWLAFALLGWLRWGWHCFSHHSLWLKLSFRRKKNRVKDDAAGEV